MLWTSSRSPGCLRSTGACAEGPRTAIDGLDFAVPEGGVFGFLGPSGAGKTTTIRRLLGLVAPTAGTCRLLGTDVRGDLHRVIDRVGAIVETPALFPTMTGRRNLELLGRVQASGRGGSTRPWNGSG